MTPEKSFEATLVELVRENLKAFCSLRNANMSSQIVSWEEGDESGSQSNRTFDSGTLNRSEPGEHLAMSVNTVCLTPLGRSRMPTRPGSETTFRVTEYFREEFQSLRHLFDIDDEQFYHSLGSSRFLQTSGGKSNSDFMITVDGKVD